MFSIEKWKKEKTKRLSSYGKHSKGKRFQDEGLMRFQRRPPSYLHNSSGQQIRTRAPSVSKVAYYFRRLHFRNEWHLCVPQLLATLLRDGCKRVLLLLPLITARPFGRGNWNCIDLPIILRQPLGAHVVQCAPWRQMHVALLQRRFGSLRHEL